ncbi:hypothetical protein QBC46DRAFT_343290 [Diplogelasinospora grovesii]|uniref:Uncharacterized protein n=1 Tax=Diplogelasinospora grovesii TaxID=303347 RepID=A0AAN6N3W2_9PEZI|nr:hypothetical protein QBC46DRAFT_343290 [Diplogelasinospora grovesii]
MDAVNAVLAMLVMALGALLSRKFPSLVSAIANRNLSLSTSFWLKDRYGEILIISAQLNEDGNIPTDTTAFQLSLIMVIVVILAQAFVYFWPTHRNARTEILATICADLVVWAAGVTLVYYMVMSLVLVAGCWALLLRRSLRRGILRNDEQDPDASDTRFTQYLVNLTLMPLGLRILFALCFALVGELPAIATPTLMECGQVFFGLIGIIVLFNHFNDEMEGAEEEEEE